MDYFNYQGNELYAEELPVSQLVSEYQSPCYIYSRQTIERHWHAFDNALSNHEHLICYAVKANSNLAILNVLSRLGSGFDVVSAGELARVIKAGGDPKKVIFSGVGKTDKEVQFALENNILCFNVESESELNHIQTYCEKTGNKAPVSLRINPNVDANTHPYISTGLKENKFGIEFEKAKAIYKAHEHYPSIEFIGIDCHIGSQLVSLAPFLDALDKLIELADELAKSGLNITHLDIGGGLGVTYDEEEPPLPHELAQAISARLKSRRFKIIMEPGRAIMANAGILVTKVLYLKPHHEKNFAIVDAAMNDFIRPALYQAWQTILPVSISQTTKPLAYDIVGPVCESGDFFGHDRMLALKENDFVAIRGAGAYGFTMSSNYNSRPRAAEIMVDGNKSFLIRKRESLDDLWRGEALLP